MLEPPLDAEDPLASARRRLEAWLEARTLRASPADGMLLSRNGGTIERIGLVVHVDRELEDVREGPFSIVTTAPARFVGVFALGTDAAPDVLAEVVSARGYVPASGATEEIVLVPGGDRDPEPRLCLLRTAVAVD